jgi:hypothetical protein
VYDSFFIRPHEKGVALDFVFSVGRDLVFRPRLLLCMTPPAADRLEGPDIRSLAFQVGMVEMISYWKAFCSPEIRILPHTLDAEGQAWWKDLFLKGLGEFFYTNGIPAPGPDLFAFHFGPEARPLPAGEAQVASPDAGRTTGEIMVPVGGGKDSVVTLELLRRAGRTLRPLVINQRGATREVIRASGVPADQVLEVERTIDPLLLELNAKGFLNGHTPFSAMLAFVASLAASLQGIQAIALSNESSASEDTIPGTGINHQYSKSLAFEAAFRSHIGRCFGLYDLYFSFLRPLNELQIAALFSGMPAYHGVFRSCNAGSRTDSWCRKCAKCLFTYVILAPFMDRDALLSVFGADLLEDATLGGLLDQLSGVAPDKPFDCVGTTGEVKAALSFLIRRYENEGRPLPALLRRYRDTQTESVGSPRLAPYLKGWHLPHFVPEPLQALLHDALRQLPPVEGGMETPGPSDKIV